MLLMRSHYRGSLVVKWLGHYFFYSLFSLLLASLPLTALSAGVVRPPAVAGAFYPADSLELYQTVSGLLDHSKLLSPRVKPVGLICPHAGYVYSGGVAAASYKQLQGFRYSSVVLVAPSHREYFGHAAVYCSGGYRTPLGTLAVDSTLAGRIVAAGGGLVQSSLHGHIQDKLPLGEHALEVQLPFLQVQLGSFRLVPIVMGDQSPALCHALALALAEALKDRKDVLLVASSDLSHFHTYEEANAIDSRLTSLVANYDFTRLQSALSRGEVEACGGGPVVAVMEASNKLGADSARIVSHANSGDVTDDKSRVVGYLSAVLYKTDNLKKQPKNSSVTGGPMGLSAKEKQYLLQLARQTIVSAVKGDSLPVPRAITAVLAEKRGAFVTIKKNGQLRGCIGMILAVRPLAETVGEMAEAAALNDPRFEPVSPAELKDLTLEISALTPVSPVNDLQAIEVGRDGLIIRRGRFQGLLLPQVATEYGWDRDTFLAQTCRKAGLPPDAWKMKDTEILSFRAEVFGEEEMP